MTLVGIGLKDTTNADGSYALASVPSGVSSRGTFTSGARFAGRSLLVSLASPTSVSVDLFDVHGGLLQSVALPNAPSGVARLDLSEAFAKAPLLLGRLRAGSTTTTFRALAMGGNVFLQDGAAAMGAARNLAVVDTLKVTATGYVSKSVALESYSQTLNVVLEAVATCNPADKTPDPVSVNVSNSGSPLTGTHQVVVETDPSLSGRTIYRPKDLAPGRNYPILVWGNGGCSNNATDHTDFHLEIASHGYVIIADGTPNGSGNRDMVDVQTLGAPQAVALSWGIQQNSKPCSRFHQALDTIHVAAFGWWLKGDVSATGKGRFTDPNCQFCKSPWTLETKRLP